MFRPQRDRVEISDGALKDEGTPVAALIPRSRRTTRRCYPVVWAVPYRLKSPPEVLLPMALASCVRSLSVSLYFSLLGSWGREHGAALMIVQVNFKRMNTRRLCVVRCAALMSLQRRILSTYCSCLAALAALGVPSVAAE